MKRLTMAVATALVLAGSPAFASDAKPADAAPASAPAAKAAPTPTPVPPPAAVGETKPAAPAAKAEPQKWWQALVYDLVFNWVLPTFLPVLLALLGWLLRKWGLKIRHETMESMARNAADYAEQKGAEWLKEKGEKSPGAKKEEWAWELVESLDRKLKGSEKLRALILSKIPEAEVKAASAAASKPADAEKPAEPEPA